MILVTGFSTKSECNILKMQSAKKTKKEGSKAAIKKRDLKAFRTHHDVAAMLSLLFTFIYIFLLSKSGHMTITYDTAVNRSIASGDMIGFPNSHLLFINYVIGVTLSVLYRILPAFNWFTLLLLFSMYFSLWAVLYRVTTLIGNDKTLKQIIGGILTICLFNFVFYENLMSIYFLNCAVIAGVSAAIYISFLDELRKRDIFIFLLMITMCAGLRFSVFRELSPFILLIFIARFLLLKKDKNSLWLIGLFFLIIGTMYVINMFAYTGIYSDEKEINHVRAAIQDYDGLPEYDTHRELYDSLGMSEEEYLIMDDCWGISDFLDVEILSAILEVNKAEHFEKQGEIIQIKGLVKNMISSDYSKIFWVLEVLSVICGLLAAIIKKDWKSLTFFGAIWITSGVEILYLAYKGRMPVRVTMLPLLIVMFVGMLYLVKSATENAAFFAKHDVALMTVVVVVFALTVGVLSETKNNYEKFLNGSERISKELDLINYILADQDNMYFCHGNHDELDLYKPIRRNYMGWGGWISETVDWKTGLLGEYEDVWEALAKRSDLRFNVADSTMVILQQGLKTRGYDCELECETVDISGTPYKFWKIISE